MTPNSDPRSITSVGLSGASYGVDAFDDERYHHGIAHPSPSQIAMTGHDFSPEDLQDFLGGVLDHNDQDHHHFHPSHHHQSDAYGSQNESTRGDCAAGDDNDNIDPNLTSQPGGDSGTDKAVARTERKRSREKQRRSDVNTKFSELTSCLRHVEAEFDSEELRSAALPTVFSPSNRADLLGRTVSLLHALNETNKRRKKEIAELKSDLEAAKRAGEEAAAKLKESLMSPQSLGGNKVMMMVPMMIGGDGHHAAAAMPMMANPWGMNMSAPQAYAMPMHSAPVPAAPASSGGNEIRNDSASSGGGSRSDTMGGNTTPMVNNVSSASTANNANASAGAQMAMSWMMPAQASSMQAGPWMMPQYAHLSSAMMPTLLTPASATSNQHPNGKTDSSTNPVGSNLAHCA